MRRLGFVEVVAKCEKARVCCGLVRRLRFVVDLSRCLGFGFVMCLGQTSWRIGP